MKPWHFYHVYADGDWLPIVREHIDALQASGLYDELDRFCVGIVGDKSNRDAVVRYLLGRCNFQIVAEQDTGWEQVTIDALHLAAAMWDQLPDTAVLYAHTKGAAYPSAHQDQWRKAMTDICVRNWDIVLSAMDYGEWDVAGCFWTREQFYEEGVPSFVGVRPVAEIRKQLGLSEIDTGEPVPIFERYHYSGNFWWSTLDWLRQLPYPCASNTRHDAEMWIGGGVDGPKPRALDLRVGSPFDRRQW